MLVRHQLRVYLVQRTGHAEGALGCPLEMMLACCAEVVVASFSLEELFRGAAVWMQNQ